MNLSSLFLILALAGPATGPANPPASAIPPPVLPDLQCLDKEGKPLPEATFEKRDPSAEFTPPKGVSRLLPQPPPTRKCKLEKVADVEFIITTKGTVCGATVVSELPPECAQFGAAALEAVKKWKFEPARAGGEPIPARFHTKVTWR